MGVSALVFLFVLALTLSFAILMLALRTASPSKSMRQRLIYLQQPAQSHSPGTPGAELEKRKQHAYATVFSNLLRRHRLFKRLQVLLVHAGSDASVEAVLLTSASAALGCALVVFLLLHQILLVAAAFLAGLSAPYAWLRFKRGRRLKAFNAALPDAIDLMARALRAGHSLNSAIELISEQSQQPLAAEFSQVYQQQKLGLRVREALLQMVVRVPSNDLQFLVTAILIQKETGGDLTEILDRTSYVIRERVRIEGDVRVHTAQGRLTGWVLGALPIAMLTLINIVSPGYSSLLFHDPTGQKLLYAGGALIVTGALVIRKIVDIEV